MRDFLPEDVRRREYVMGIITRVYERYGFEPLETPAVENIETLMGKYGDEGNQLIFKILMRGEHEATGKADLALRYDLTVPLARVIAHHQSKLPRLFKMNRMHDVTVKPQTVFVSYAFLELLLGGHVARACAAGVLSREEADRWCRAPLPAPRDRRRSPSSP